jgi:hypothetical protein
MNAPEEYERYAALVANTEITPQQLFAAIRTHAKEVLAHPCLPLWSLETPRVVANLCYKARYKIVLDLVEPLARFPVSVLRRVACEAVQAVLPQWAAWKPRVSPPEGAAYMHPSYAVTLALQQSAEKKPNRKILSWAARFAESFDEWRSMRAHSAEEVAWSLATHALADLCKGCCSAIRTELWQNVTLAVEYAHPRKNLWARDPSQFNEVELLLQVEALEKYAARLIELLPVKKKRRAL